MALCGLSEVNELSDMASYLQVDTEEWFDWSEETREEYVLKFNKLTVEDIMKERANCCFKKSADVKIKSQPLSGKSSLMMSRRFLISRD